MALSGLVQKEYQTSRELITLNVGGFGINIGQTTLEQYCGEQGISPTAEKEHKTQYDHSIHTTYKEKSNGQYEARSLFIDSLPYSISLMQNTFAYSRLINQNYCISGHHGSHNLFARAHITVAHKLEHQIGDGTFHLFSFGDGLCDLFSDKLRLMIEECDAFQGFIVNNSISGGTGGGLGVLLLERIAVDYRKKAKIGFHAMLDATKSTTPSEIINSLLTMYWLNDHTHASIFFDNCQLYDICKNKLNIKVPRYRHYNYLCNKLISNITAPWRFSLGEDVNIFARDMVPFPKLHYLTTSLAPIIPKNGACTDDIDSLTEECFKPNNFFYKCNNFDPKQDKYMAVKLNYRGNDIGNNVLNINKCVKTTMHKTAKTYEICVNDKSIYDVYKKSINWMEWCNDKPCVKCIDDKIMKLEHDDIYCGNKQVTMVGNNNYISKLISERILKRYDILHSQRAYIHWQILEGLEESECQEARENLRLLENEYSDISQESDNNKTERNIIQYHTDAVALNILNDVKKNALNVNFKINEDTNIRRHFSYQYDNGWNQQYDKHINMIMCGNQTNQRKIIVHFKDNTFEFCVDDLDDLDDAMYLYLISSIRSYFKFPNNCLLSLYEIMDGSNIDVDAVDDIIDAFQANNGKYNYVLHLFVKNEMVRIK